MLHLALHLVVHLAQRRTCQPCIGISVANPITGASLAGVGGWSAACRRHAGGRTAQVHAAQHGQVSCLAVPELGPYACSGRAWQLWVARLS